MSPRRVLVGRHTGPSGDSAFAPSIRAGSAARARGHDHVEEPRSIASRDACPCRRGRERSGRQHLRAHADRCPCSSASTSECSQADLSVVTTQTSAVHLAATVAERAARLVARTLTGTCLTRGPRCPPRAAQVAWSAPLTVAMHQRRDRAHLVLSPSRRTANRTRYRGGPDRALYCDWAPVQALTRHRATPRARDASPAMRRRADLARRRGRRSACTAGARSATRHHLRARLQRRVTPSLGPRGVGQGCGEARRHAGDVDAECRRPRCGGLRPHCERSPPRGPRRPHLPERLSRWLCENTRPRVLSCSSEPGSGRASTHVVVG